jgi:hypothetical protein
MIAPKWKIVTLKTLSFLSMYGELICCYIFVVPICFYMFEIDVPEIYVCSVAGAAERLF